MQKTAAVETRHPPSALLIGIAGLVISALVAIAAGVVGFSRLPFALSNIAWVVVYTLLITGALVLWRAGRYRLLAGISLGVVGGLTGVALVFSGSGPAMVAWLWIMLLCVGIGNLLLGWLKLSRPRTGGFFALAEHLLLSAALGLGVLSLAPYALGAGPAIAAPLHLPERFFRLLQPIPMFAVLLVLSGLCAPGLYRLWKDRPAAELAALRSRLVRGEPALAIASAILALCFLGVFLWALSPTIRFDSVVYHLAAPERYIQSRALVNITEPVQFYMSHNAEMLYTLALLVAGQPLPGLLHLFSGLLAVGLTYCLGRQLGSPWTGAAAALLFFSLPLFYDAGTAHNDFFVALFSLASFYALLLWWREDRSAWLLVAGLLAGLSVGTKINGAMPAAVAGLAVLTGQVLRHTGWKKALGELALYGLPIPLLFAPWGLLAGLWTGDPFYPFFCQAFQCTVPATAIDMGPAGAQLAKLLPNFLLLPWNITVFGDAYYIENFGGAAGAVFLLGLPWLLFWKGAPPKLARSGRLLALFVAASLFSMITFAYRARYLLPVVPLICVLAALNLEILWCALPRVPRPVALRRGLILLGALYLLVTRLVFTSSGWQVEDRYPLRLALGLETPERYLSSALPAYDALRFLDRVGDGRHKVASFGSETRMYTASDVRSPYFSAELPNLLAGAKDLPALAQGLSRASYDYVLVDSAGILVSGDIGDDRIISQPFLSQYARLVFARHGVSLYRLFPQDAATAPAEGANLLENGGFENAASGLPAGWTALGSPTLDSSGSQASGGKAAVKVSNAGYLYQRVPVEGGRLYTLGSRSRSETAGQGLRLQVLWLDRDTRPITATIEKYPATAQWAWRQLSYSAPDNAVTAQIFIITEDAGTAWFDDACFAAGPECRP